MQRLYRLFPVAAIVLVLAGTLAYTSSAKAQQAGTPLVVIRFNQARVYYDQQLYSAISQAVAVKPDVTFDVVSNAPSTGDSSRDEQWIETASRNTQAVVAVMKSIGVPMERMRISGQVTPGIRFDETHVYAR
jgi:hypothetical protein